MAWQEVYSGCLERLWRAMLGEETRIAMFVEIIGADTSIRAFERVVECRRCMESAREWYGV